MHVPNLKQLLNTIGSSLKVFMIKQKDVARRVASSSVDSIPLVTASGRNWHS